jgi:hypothetical protein
VTEDRRFGDRTDIDPGGDGWGTVGTFSFLTAAPNSFMVFNDISFEHGGIMRLRPGCDPLNDTECAHTLHQCGLSIDSRYFGPRGDADELNGTPDRDRGTKRLEALEMAQDGDADAQRKIARWIKLNRERMSQLANRSDMSTIYIGNAEWNTLSLIDGKYPNGSEIIDPETGQAIGCWIRPPEENQPCRKPAKVRPINRHLSHVHIERAQ